MTVYTVRKARPNTDQEFQAYIDLLQGIGIDVSDVPRMPEPGTSNRWLYVWNSKPQAERFARELGTRLRDHSWQVYEFDVPDDEPPFDRRGPLVPLTIISIPTREGTEFWLDSASQERVMGHYPNARMVGHVLFPDQVRESALDQVVVRITGIPEDAVGRLGGVRIVTRDGRVLHERVPVAQQ